MSLTMEYLQDNIFGNSSIKSCNCQISTEPVKIDLYRHFKESSSKKILSCSFSPAIFKSLLTAQQVKNRCILLAKRPFLSLNNDKFADKTSGDNVSIIALNLR